MLDFPTPEFPENTLVLFCNSCFNSSMPIFCFALVTITLYPTLVYNSFIVLYSSFKSHLLTIIIGSIFIFSEYANCLSSINKSGFGFLVDIINTIWSMFAIFGLFISFFLVFISSIIASFFSSSITSISTLSPTSGFIS